MKRYVKHVSCSSKKEALEEIGRRLRSQGYNAEVHLDHGCVDVFTRNGLIIEQHYPERTDIKRDGTRNRYKYVGPGNGDYIKQIQNVHETDYTPDDPYIKYVSHTNKKRQDRANF